MSNFYDADIVINFLIKKKLIANIDWKKYNNSKYTASFNREDGLNGVIYFEITVENEKYLIRLHNFSIMFVSLKSLIRKNKQINKELFNLIFKY